jgi:hypothetical protein
MILLPCEEGVVPGFDHVLLRNGLDLGKTHDHALVGGTGSCDYGTAECDFDGVAMAVQMPALATVV